MRTGGEEDSRAGGVSLTAGSEKTVVTLHTLHTLKNMGLSHTKKYTQSISISREHKLYIVEMLKREKENPGGRRTLAGVLDGILAEYRKRNEDKK